MGKRNALRLALIVVTVLVVAAGCASAPGVLKAPEAPYVSGETEGFRASLRFLDDAALKREFGVESNPFLTRYSRLSFQRIVVFALEAQNDDSQPIELVLKRCELSIGDKKAMAVTRVDLINYWQVQEGEFYPQRARQKELVINRSVLETRKRIPPGATVRGYLVFQGDLPDHGNAAVSLGLYRGDRRVPLDLSFLF